MSDASYSACTLPEDEPPLDEELLRYRAVNRMAVASFAATIFGLGSFFTPLLLVLTVAGIAMGLIAGAQIRKYPLEFTGGALAKLGVYLGIAILLGASAMHAAVYATEVPPGCQRISFADLQPLKTRPDLPIPPQALELDGKRIFVKGYVFPDGQQANIKQFILVPDMGTCCFGGQPALTDMIQVTLRDPLRTVFALKKRKLAGVFRVNQQLKPVNGVGGVVYELDADYLR